MPHLTEEQVALLKDNHYKTLGIAQNASDSEIKSAFRKLALKHHPDRHSGSTTPSSTAKKGHEEFIKIKTAYDTLSDPNTRASYDSKLRLAQALHSKPSLSSKPSYNSGTFFTTTSKPTAQPSYSYFRKPSTTFPTTAAFEAHQASNAQARARATQERLARERLEKLRRDAEEALRNSQAAKARREREKKEQEELRRSWEEARKRRSAGNTAPNNEFTGRSYENPIPPGSSQKRREAEGNSYNFSDTSTDGSTISDSPMPDSPSAETKIDPDIEEQKEWEAERDLERKREAERQRIRQFRRMMNERAAAFKIEQEQRERAFRAEQERLQQAFDRGEEVVPGVGSSPRSRQRAGGRGRKVPIVEDPPASSRSSTSPRSRRPEPTTSPIDTDPELEEIDPTLYSFPQTSGVAGFGKGGFSSAGFGPGGLAAGLGGMGGLGTEAFPLNLDVEIGMEFERLRRTKEEFSRRTGGMFGVFGEL